MNTMVKSSCAALGALLSASLHALSLAPTISSVSMTQDNPSSREVTISYNLENGPAIVTVDIQTNASDDVWVSIGAENLTCMTGDANILVGSGARSVSWRPDRAWPGHLIANSGARAVLTAYSTENPPDYMVVDLAEYSPVRCRYYASTNCIPGGLFAKCYRTTHMVLRRINAKGVTWSMGTFSEINRSGAESLHQVQMERDYWIGVFEVTASQWEIILGQTVRSFCSLSSVPFADIRPMEYTSYAKIRECNANTENVVPESSPAVPHADSYLGRIRARTGLDFDLPTEAEWEYACRAGHGENEYGNGAVYRYAEGVNLPDIPGRYQSNQAHPGYVYWNLGSGTGPEDGPAPCGYYPPNDWGLYDMHGNVWEFCLGRWSYDITALNGAPVMTGGTAVRRGGGWMQSTTNYLRSGCRIDESPTVQVTDEGFRVVCHGMLP
ncbi:MAG: SUMF1/EgtB/PvdO family nonheme iron enzyme [Kiritimatiellae bacterium]|nr:SUMF1/EgtB/PvdO family nonheme iron enzyme [Kiritimatiellia bacterium]